MAADIEILRLIMKPIPVLVLAIAVWMARPTHSYHRLVAVGLAFGAAGDLLLELDLFVFGLVAFLIGHLFYIRAFLLDDRQVGVLQAFPWVVWVVAMVASLSEGAGDLLIPGAVYLTVLGAMAWRALTRMGSVSRASGVSTAAGATLFAISDSLIAIDRFGTDIPGSRWWIMTTYWAAQALIAYGALRRAR